MTAKFNPYANLPKVVHLIAKDDAGEFGAATCPHCGAEGRYVYWFVCDDGQRHGAMKGCFAKFPKHRFVAVHERIMDKQTQNERKGWRLASWDQDTLDAIEAFARGELSEADANRAIDAANCSKKAWMQSRGYARR